MKTPPSPLSSRAKPRGLQFCRPVLEMFFDRVLMQVEVNVCRVSGVRTMLGNRCRSPARAGLTFGRRPYGPRSPDRSLENISRTSLQNCRFPFDFAQGRLSATLGMTKGKAMFPCASVGCWREQQVPPLRCASVGMTKGKTGFPLRAVAEQKPLSSLGRPKAQYHSFEKIVPSVAFSPGISPDRR
jgi:hypothetical protein